MAKQKLDPCVSDPRPIPCATTIYIRKYFILPLYIYLYMPNAGLPLVGKSYGAYTIYFTAQSICPPALKLRTLQSDNNLSEF